MQYIGKELNDYNNDIAVIGVNLGVTKLNGYEKALQKVSSHHEMLTKIQNNCTKAFLIKFFSLPLIKDLWYTMVKNGDLTTEGLHGLKTEQIKDKSKLL